MLGPIFSYLKSSLVLRNLKEMSKTSKHIKNRWIYSFTHENDNFDEHADMFHM